MPLYRLSDEQLVELPSTQFAAERLREREDLQRLFRRDIQVLGEDLLLVAEEYGLFQDSRRRIDLLALDRSGRLVVVELKRTDDGGHMELQALRYAAMVSTMNRTQLVECYAHTHGVDPDEAHAAITAHLDDADSLDLLPDDVRIILVSRDFSQEITATVLWLRTNYQLDIVCYRIIPYRIGTELIIDLDQLIPLREAAEFQVQQRQKQAAAVAARAGIGRDYTKYDLSVAGRTQIAMSKQAVLKAAIQELFRHGVPLAAIQEATSRSRWVAVRAASGESVERAFVREYPDRKLAHRWFDLGIAEDGVTWVIPRFGGSDVEPFAVALADASEGYVDFSITPSATSDVL